MDPLKKSFDNKRAVIDFKPRIPGQIGWGLERKHLRAKSNIITDDMQVKEYPIPKHVIQGIDKHKTAKFTQYEGDRAQNLDKKLKVDYHMYHSLNMQA